MFLKKVIEDQDGYRLFYSNGQPIKREADLQVIYRLVWYGSPLDVNREVNNGRGPVDYKISYGSKNSTLVEFKLASNSKLKQNLAKQVDVYKAIQSSFKYGTGNKSNPFLLRGRGKEDTRHLKRAKFSRQ